MLMELDFMIPKESASSLLFMNRYGLQITDNNIAHSSGSVCGSILPSQNNSGENNTILPMVNNAKAPGLWQNFKVLFRAPRFDQEGHKETNAKFEFVYHNGYLIHDNVELEGPTIETDVTDEVSSAPLKIQSSRGPLAIKEIKYKTYEPDTIRFSELSYRVYDGKYSDSFDYSTMTSVKNGKTSSFRGISELSGRNEAFVIVYEGEFSVPAKGDYLIETIINEGGNLYVDDSISVRSLLAKGVQKDRNIVHLNKGRHSFLTDCYSSGKRGTKLVLNIEGPNMEKRAYLSEDIASERDRNRRKLSYNIDIDQSIEMIRGFVDHKDQKFTHTLSVGNPNGVHYSYDTRYNALLNVWKGDFADVSQMWLGRGNQQKLRPRNAILSLNSGISFINADLDHDPKGYRLTNDGRPIFNFSHGKVAVIDDIKSNADGTLTRTLQFENKGNVDRFRIAEEQGIIWLNDDWATIGNLYHLAIRKGKEHVSITPSESIDQLLYNIPIGTSTLSYDISW